jgi:acetyl-CoA C-acetyltransferase
MTTEAYVFDGVRTPRGKGRHDGALHGVKPVSLVSGLLTQLGERNPSLDRNQIDDVILGVVTPHRDQGANLARTAALLAGYETSGPGFQLNRFCGSGLEAINTASQKIRSGWDDLIIAGGVESMSRVPIGSDGGPLSIDPETAFATNFIPQGVSADLIATIEGFDREQLDGFALVSQERAAKALADGAFARSMTPVRDRAGSTILDTEEFPRPGTTLAGLGRLKPSFESLGNAGFDAIAQQRYPQVHGIDHVHTAGNSSGIVDGAAVVLIGSEEAGRRMSLEPRARVVASAVVATEPTIMLTGPAPAARRALARAGLQSDDIDLYEINEAFAAVVLKFMKDVGVAHDVVNVNGGAIALGHPLGATGVILILTLLDELERRQQRYGLCTLCVGAGIGIATIIERL